MDIFKSPLDHYMDTARLSFMMRHPELKKNFFQAFFTYIRALFKVVWLTLKSWFFKYLDELYGWEVFTSTDRNDRGIYWVTFKRSKRTGIIYAINDGFIKVPYE